MRSMLMKWVLVGGILFGFLGAPVVETFGPTAKADTTLAAKKKKKKGKGKGKKKKKKAKKANI